jgi:H+/Cl- antiporter ClcA
MKKSLIALATAVATLGLVAQASTANAFLLKDRSPNVQAGQIIAGLGMTAAYYAAICNRNFNHCARFDSARSLKYYGLTTIGCFALSPIIGGMLVSMNEKRELKSSEVFMMVGDCVVPIIGGWLMKAAFDANPQWDAGTGRARQ